VGKGKGGEKDSVCWTRRAQDERGKKAICLQGRGRCQYNKGGVGEGREGKGKGEGGGVHSAFQRERDLLAIFEQGLVMRGAEGKKKAKPGQI